MKMGERLFIVTIKKQIEQKVSKFKNINCGREGESGN